MHLLIEKAGTVAIIATSPALLDREEADLLALCATLDVAAPVNWPPDFNGQAYRDWQRKLLATHPTEPGYAGWYVIGAGELVGTCGFKGPPDAEGVVEIGYSVVEARRRMGHASGAVRLLLERAFADPRVGAVVAETEVANQASRALLHRCGFELESGRMDPEDGEVLRLVRKRPGHTAGNAT